MTKQEFDNLPPEQKRIELAKDVIEQIESAHFVAHDGIFLRFKENPHEMTVCKDTLQQNKCYVCAKGAGFAALVERYNDFSKYVSDVENFYDFGEKEDVKLSEYVEIFGRETLDNMEAAFERMTYPWHYNEGKTEFYTQMYLDLDKKERMLAIMNNIIKNNGNFVLEKM